MGSLLARWPGLKWLYPGIGVKRWILVLMAGIVAASIGGGYVLVTVYRERPLPAVFYYITLQFIPRLDRAILFVFVGSGLIAVALYYLNRSLLSVLVASGAAQEQGAAARPAQAVRGPSIVAVGGGHGLSTLLRGLKTHTNALTAVVTVADDGGSSGALREGLGMIPPGDLRNCLVALAEAEPLMTQLFQYRFGRGTGLDGHAFGNLFIAAMTGVTGDFERAVSEASRVLAVQGRILPSSLQNVTLCAEVRRSVGAETESLLVHGQSQIAQARGKVERVYLQPGDARGCPEAIRALLHADLIVLGPGSLYTSVLPNLLVEDIGSAIKASPALKVYVCNVATQPGETDGYTAGDHLSALREHLGRGLIDYVVANANTAFQLAPTSGSEMVLPLFDAADEPRVVREDLVDREYPWRHDPAKLASVLMRLYYAHQAALAQKQEAHG